MSPLPQPISVSLLTDATWTELADTLRTPRVLVVPIGSCEQHGPHLPLDTDSRIACAVAAGLSSARPEVLIAPVLGVTASGEHRGFAGTLSIGVAVLEMVLIELVRSADWSAGVVFVNGHGGNTAAVNAAVEVLRGEGRRVLAWWPRIDDGDAHAGRTETSLILAISPEMVRLHVASPGRTEPLAELLAELRSGGVAAVSPNGVLGNPANATAAEGSRLLNSLVHDLVDRFDAWVR